MPVPLPMPVISRGAPAYTNDNDSGVYPASNADDADYSTIWRTGGTPSPSVPLYLAYDLSGVPTAQRGQCLLCWYNPLVGDYDFVFAGSTAFNLAEDYTIDANAAPGGSLPSSGWVTLVTVTGNNYHSRQHRINLTGYNWVRLNCTAIQGTTFNLGCALNMDIHNISAGIQDDMLLMGDSITRGGLSVDNNFGIGSLAQLINATAPANFPVCEAAGVGGMKSSDGAGIISTWLALFPGRYVAIAYGTNDATANISPSVYQSNMQSMINAIKGTGATTIIPHIPWGSNTGIQQHAPSLNAVIDSLVAADPTHIIAGPDLWAFFQANPSLISSDQIHPTTAGYTALRQQWAQSLLASVYGITPPINATMLARKGAGTMSARKGTITLIGRRS